MAKDLAQHAPPYEQILALLELDVRARREERRQLYAFLERMEQRMAQRLETRLKEELGDSYRGPRS